jgi:hypothetical protein
VHGVCDCARGFKGDDCQDMRDSEVRVMMLFAMCSDIHMYAVRCEILLLLYSPAGKFVCSVQCNRGGLCKH